jgi:hypothetical protein
MEGGLASWLVIILALLAANLPFFNERLFGVLPLERLPLARSFSHPGPDGQPTKGAWVRVLELLVLYFVVGGIARLLEGRIGAVHEQTKEFYMTTVPLFVVLAFPGFILRYLRRPPR